MTYWVLALALTVFGFLTGFSIGPPFLLIGVTLLALGPFRSRARLFWPVLAGIVAFIVVVVLLVPLTCVATSYPADTSQTVCSSILGPTWSGNGLHNAPSEAFTTPLQLGVAAGLVVAAAAVVGLTIRQARERMGKRSGNDPSNNIH